MYKVTVSSSAEKELYKLPDTIIKRIGIAIESLAAEPRPLGSKKLKGTEENLWRIRNGDYRVLYDIKEIIKIIDIKKVGHRKEIYK